jgi:hypothetical protein
MKKETRLWSRLFFLKEYAKPEEHNRSLKVQLRSHNRARKNSLKSGIPAGQCERKNAGAQTQSPIQR